MRYRDVLFRHLVRLVSPRKRLLPLQCLRRNYQTSSICFGQQPATSIRSWYWDTVPPTAEQLGAAHLFFQTHPPRKLWTASEWRRLNNDPSSALTPEVAFLGRSNVGKSSLLNALLFSPKLNRVGPRPGKTITMHAYGLSAADPKTGGAVKGMGGQIDTKLAILDMPGYGHASRSDWGEEIIKYFRRRKQLKRIFIMFDAMHGVKAADMQMLKLLQSQGISYQVIASKCDRFPPSKRETELVQSLQKFRNVIEQPDTNSNAVLGLGEILTVGSLGDGKLNQKVDETAMQGIENVRWAVLRATGLEEYAMNTALEAKTSAAPRVQLEQVPFVEPLRGDLNVPSKKPSPTQPVSIGRGIEEFMSMSTNAKNGQHIAEAPKSGVREPKTRSASVGRGIEDLLSMTSAPKSNQSSKPKMSGGRKVRWRTPQVRR